MWLASWLLIIACGGGRTDPLQKHDDTRDDGPHERRAPPGLTPEETAFIPTFQVFADDLQRTSEACDAGLIHDIDLTAVETAPFPFDLTAVDAACGEASHLWEQRHVALEGRVASADFILQASARVGDDVDYLRRSFADGRGSERRNAVEHVREALARASEAAKTWPTEYHESYGTRAAQREAWSGDVRLDHERMNSLRGFLQRYAFLQGFDASHVRWRMLGGFGATERARLASRQALLNQGGSSADDLAQRQAYLRTVTAMLDAFDEISKGFLADDLTEQARDAYVARADATLAAWKAAWDVESARQPAR